MMDMWQQMRGAMILARLDAHTSPAIDSHDVLAMGTLTAARALGLEREIGSLEPGKQADIILIDLDQAHLGPITPYHDPVKVLVHNVSGGDIAMVMVGGEIVVENRKALRVDESEVVETGWKHADQVMTRAEKL